MRGDTNGYRDVNKPRRYRSDPTCKGKMRYPDEVSVRAYGAITIAERKTQHRLWCYRCRHCRGWHLTSTNEGKRYEIAAPQAPTHQSSSSEMTPEPAVPAIHGSSDGRTP